MRLLSVVLLLSVFLTACNTRRDRLSAQLESILQNTETNPVIHAPESGETSPVFAVEDLPTEAGFRLDSLLRSGDRGYYEDLTPDALEEMFIPGRIEPGQRAILTPTGVFLFTDDGLACFYNKITGNISPLCPDPMCDGEGCIWQALSSVDVCFVGREHIYFAPEGDGYEQRGLYRCDRDRNHVTKLLDSFETSCNVWAEDGDLLYVTLPIYRENDTAVEGFGTLHMQTGEFTCLSGDKRVRVMAVIGEDVYYADPDDPHNTLQTDLSFSASTPAIENGMVYAYSSTHMVIAEWGGATARPVAVRDLTTGREIPIPGESTARGYVLDGQYLYYIKQISEADTADHPLRDYLEYETTIVERVELPYGRPARENEVTVVCHNRDLGAIYRLDLSTMQEECVLKLTYNDVPVMVTEGFTVDGGVCYFQFLTYEDYNNYYNPTYPFDYIHRHEPYHYAVADFSNGTVTIIDPADAEKFG